MYTHIVGSRLGESRERMYFYPFKSNPTGRKKTHFFGNTPFFTPREHLSFAPTVSVTWHLRAPRPLPSTNSVTAVTQLHAVFSADVWLVRGLRNRRFHAGCTGVLSSTSLPLLSAWKPPSTHERTICENEAPFAENECFNELKRRPAKTIFAPTDQKTR